MMNHWDKLKSERVQLIILDSIHCKFFNKDEVLEDYLKDLMVLFSYLKQSQIHISIQLLNSMVYSIAKLGNPMRALDFAKQNMQPAAMTKKSIDSLLDGIESDTVTEKRRYLKNVWEYIKNNRLTYKTLVKIIKTAPLVNDLEPIRLVYHYTEAYTNIEDQRLVYTRILNILKHVEDKDWAFCLQIITRGNLQQNNCIYNWLFDSLQYPINMEEINAVLGYLIQNGPKIPARELSQVIDSFCDRMKVTDDKRNKVGEYIFDLLSELVIK
jgi:hypothetical protein